MKLFSGCTPASHKDGRDSEIPSNLKLFPLQQRTSSDENDLSEDDFQDAHEEMQDVSYCKL